MQWVFTPLACDVEPQSLDSVLRELKERIKNAEVLGEMGLAMEVLAERNQRVTRLRERIWPILGEEIMEESITLRREREKAQEKGRRAELLELIGEVVDSETMSELQKIENLDELRRRIRALVRIETRER